MLVSLCMSDKRGSGDMLEMSVVRAVGGVCDMFMCSAWGGVGGEMIGFRLYQFWRNMGKVGYVSVFWLRWCA